MKHISKYLNASKDVLSLEEIDAEIDAVEAAPEALEDTVDDVVENAEAVEAEPDEGDALEKDTCDVEESLEEIDTAAEVGENLENTVQVMEALIEAGGCSLVEYTGLSEYAGTQLARLEMESFAFSAESIETPEGRLEGLRMALEAIQENSGKIKKALESAAKDTEKKAASLWDKMLALLGNRVKKVKVMLSKVDSLGEPSREEVSVSSAISSKMVGGDATRTLGAVKKAADYLYGGLYDDIAEWSSRKTKTIPSVNQDLFKDLPGSPRISFGSSMIFKVGRYSGGSSFNEKVKSKGELKQILKGVESLLETIKKASTKFSSLVSKIFQIYMAANTGKVIAATTMAAGPLAGLGSALVNGTITHAVMMLFSRGYNTAVKMQRVYNYFGDLAMAVVDYVGYHVKAYK